MKKRVLEGLYWDEEKKELNWDSFWFEDHPDEAAIPAECLPEWLVLPVKELHRQGAGYVLPDGEWLFPGDSFITRVITE